MKALVSFLFVLFANVSIAQNTFQRIYPSTDPCGAINFINTLDGNYLVYGHAYNSGNNIINLFKIDTNGDSIWAHSYVYPGLQLNQLIGLHDSSFAVFATWNNYSVIIKYDKNGDSLWSKQYTYPSLFGPSSYSISLLETSDHGFYMVTAHEDSDVVDYDLRFSRLDSMGNELWVRDHIYGFEQIGYGYMIKSSDDRYFLQIRLSSGGPSTPFSDVIKVDSSGNILSSSFMWEPGNMGGDLIAKGSDNSFIILGNPRDNWDYNYYGGFRKIDSAGTTIWDTAFSQFSGFGSVSRTSDNGFIIACDSTDFLLKRFDENGNLIWSKSFPINHKEGATAVKQTPDGGFIAVGFHRLTLDRYETYIIKTDSLGNIITNGFSVHANNLSPCEGDTITLTTQNAVDYLWSNSQTTQSIDITRSGSFNVRVSDLGGNHYYSNFYNVIFNPKPEINLGNDTLVCFFQNLELNAGNGFVNYLWQDGSTSQILNVSSSSQDLLQCFVQVTDTLGCTNSDSIQVIIDICDGIEKIKSDELFSFGSNPAYNDFSLQFKNPGSGQIEIMIYNSMGEIVFEKNTSGKDEIVISSLQCGIYFVVCKTEKLIMTRKIIKLK